MASFFRPVLPALLAMAGVLFAGHAEANAQPACGSHAAMKRELESGNGEQLLFSGLSHDGALVQFWGAGPGRGWTATVTRPAGPTCVVEHGRSLVISDFVPGQPS